MPKWSHATFAIGILISFAWPATAWAQSAPPNPSTAITTLPAYYSFTKTVTFTNQGNAPALDVKAHVVLEAPPTQYAHVTLTGYSMAPSSTHRDQNGNLIGDYQLNSLKPHQSITLTLHYQATSSDISYRLPSTYPSYNVNSTLYKKYTNPKLDASVIDANTPPIEALDKKLVGNTVNPYQRAQTLFNWVAYHIQYNYSLQASGTALKTLQAHLGICSDFAYLYVSMLRTDGIPARLIGGYVTNNGDGQGGFHQWVEFYLPHTGWIVADPTWGRYGYFASLQDDWHIPLYDGIRPDISVAWQYAKTTNNTSPYVAINYHYHFVTEQSPTMAREVKLPLVSVTPPTKHTATLNQTFSWANLWRHVSSLIHQYVLRLKFVLASL